MNWRLANPHSWTEERRLFRNSLLFLLLAVLSLGCAAHPPQPPHGFHIEGKVSLGGRGFAGAQVSLLSPRFYLPPVQSPITVTETSSEGAFQLRAPPGTYLLLAHNSDGFGYFGRNPLRLSGPVSGVNLPLVATHPLHTTPVPPGDEALTGRILHRGQPLPAARVFVYLDPERGFRGPGYAMSEPSDENGQFHLSLPPGTYFIVARMRQGGWKPGALEPGDLYGVLPEFPLRLTTGQQATIAIETLTVPSQEQMARYRQHITLLSGVIVDRQGHPLAGMRACLYDNPQMLSRPLAISEPTRADGRFELEVDRQGTLFLGARQKLGGPPGRGETIGFYRGEKGSQVELTAGKTLDELTIVVQAVVGDW